MSEIELYEFIAKSRLGVLSTLSLSGKPQSALVGFAATRSLEIVFDTVASSRKYANLMAAPDCSFVFGWAGEQTVQYEGRAELLDGGGGKFYLETYFRVWPDGRDRLNWPGLVHFVVHPTWIRYSDFDRRPPLIQEFPFPISA